MKIINTEEWQEFKVGALFTSERGKIKKLQSLREGKIPVIAAARKNQGVAGYYDVEAPFNNQITISCNGVGCGSTFYHDYPFNVNGDAIVLKEKQSIPEGAKLFISCMLDGLLTRKYSYAEKCSPEKASEEIIKLPIVSKDTPDWAFMEKQMSLIKSKVNKEIELIQRIIKE